ncbi:hypothetical protein OG218_26175 [Kineococcus sp. NBC_00420]|uniref:hypothetical protein n=1 Tax=Kineococcus sp. NBC_00420 TaxID=2903564 RepID=UPI002E1D3995
MGAPVTVLGKDLVVEKAWSRRPRVMHNGQELPRDRWGAPVLVDEEGRSHQVQAGFSWRQLSPTVELDGRTVLASAPLPIPVRVVLLAFVVVGFFGGAIGVVLSMSAALVSAALLRRPGRNAGHVIGAVVVPLAAVVVFLLVAVWLS